MHTDSQTILARSQRRVARFFTKQVARYGLFVLLASLRAAPESTSRYGQRRVARFVSETYPRGIREVSEKYPRLVDKCATRPSETYPRRIRDVSETVSETYPRHHVYADTQTLLRRGTDASTWTWTQTFAYACMCVYVHT